MISMMRKGKSRMALLPNIRSGLTALLLLAVAVPTASAVEAQRVLSDGGIEAWLVEDHSIPVIAMDVAFKGGATLDPEGKSGRAYMVSGLLDEGAGDMDSFAFQTMLENEAIGLGFDASRDSFTASLKTITENKDKAFDVLRLALMEPRFDNEPVSRVRSQILTGLKFDLEDPNTVASRKFNEVLFGDHPYSRPTKGTPESIKDLTVEDFRQFLKSQVTKDRMFIGVAGDISPEELKAVLDDTFGDLPAESDLADAPSVTPTTGETYVVETNIPQSVALFGHEGLPREHPLFYAAYLNNYILGGGGFVSRLMEEVREKRGLAYGVSSYLYSLDHADLVIGTVATNNAKIGESLDIVRQEWAKMAENGPTAEELANAKTYLTGAWPLRFTSTGNISGILASMQLDGYPIEHLETRNAKVEAVTLEQAKDAAALVLKPDALTTVVVGQPVGVEQTAKSTTAH